MTQKKSLSCFSRVKFQLDDNGEGRMTQMNLRNNMVASKKFRSAFTAEIGTTWLKVVQCCTNWNEFSESHCQMLP